MAWIQLYFWSCFVSLYHKFPDEPYMDGENENAAGKEVSNCWGVMDATGQTGVLLQPAKAIDHRSHRKGASIKLWWKHSSLFHKTSYRQSESAAGLMFFCLLHHCVTVNHTSRRQREFDSNFFQLNASQSLVDLTAIRDSANNVTA